MENNAELKEKLGRFFASDRYSLLMTWDEVIEHLLLIIGFHYKENFVPKSEYEELADKLEGIERLETTIAELKAEIDEEKFFTNQQRDSINDMAKLIEHLQSDNSALNKTLSETKAENERLVSANIDLKQATHAISEKCLSLQDAADKARQEERARIVEICKFALMEIIASDQQLRLEPESICNPNKRNEAVNTALTATCKQYNLELQQQDLLPVGEELGQKIIEVLKGIHSQAITADQPTQTVQFTENKMFVNGNWVKDYAKLFLKRGEI